MCSLGQHYFKHSITHLRLNPGFVDVFVQYELPEVVTYIILSVYRRKVVISCG